MSNVRARLLISSIVLAAAVLFGGLALSGGPNHVYATTNCDVTNLAIDSEEQAFLGLINGYRAQNGLGALTMSANLNRAASWLAVDMATKNYFDHTDSLGRTPATRRTQCGNPTAGYGENIAAGYATAQAAFNAWKASPGHNANMLTVDAVQIGIARYYGSSSTYGWYWVTDLSWANDGTTVGSTSTPPVAATATPTKTSTPTTAGATPTNTPVTTTAAATPTKVPGSVTSGATPTKTPVTTTASATPTPATQTSPEGISLVKTIGTSSVTKGGTQSVAVPTAGVPVGHRVIVTVQATTVGGSVGCSDTKGNIYTIDVDTAAGSSGRLFICSAHVVSALTGGDQVTATYPSASSPTRMIANEFSGLAATAATDKTSFASGNSSLPSSGTTGVTSQARELVFGAIMHNGTNSGTLVSIAPGFSHAGDLSLLHPMYRTTSAAGTYSAGGKLSTGNTWRAVVVTYKEAP